MFTLKPESTDYAFTDACRDYSGTITCNVTLAETGEIIPFTASPDDTEEYGRVLYEQLNTTDLASVKPFSDEDRATQDALNVRQKRNILLSNTDWTQTPDVPETTRNLWTTYRQALRDIPQQADFPSTITWPTAP